MLNDKNPRRFWDNYKMIDRTKNWQRLRQGYFRFPAQVQVANAASPLKKECIQRIETDLKKKRFIS